MDQHTNDFENKTTLSAIAFSVIFMAIVIVIVITIVIIIVIVIVILTVNHKIIQQLFRRPNAEWAIDSEPIRARGIIKE